MSVQSSRTGGAAAGGWGEDGIYWYKNPGASAKESGKPWEMHNAWEARLLSKTRGTMEMFALHDFNADGEPELYSANYRKQHPLEVWRFTKTADGATALTPFVLGAVRDVTDSFDAVLWTCAGFLVLLVVLVWLLPRPAGRYAGG